MTPEVSTGRFVPPSPQQIRRYRLAAVAILLAGLLGAGVVYWIGSRQPDYSNDPALTGFNRAEERQLGVLYGKQGQLIEDLDESLKRPGTQAGIIIAAAGLLAAGCFYFAHILELEARDAAAGVPPRG